MNEVQQMLHKMRSKSFMTEVGVCVPLKDAEEILQELEIKILNNATRSFSSKRGTQPVPESKATIIGMAVGGNKEVPTRSR